MTSPMLIILIALFVVALLYIVLSRVHHWRKRRSAEAILRASPIETVALLERQPFLRTRLLERIEVLDPSELIMIKAIQMRLGGMATRTQLADLTQAQHSRLLDMADGSGAEDLDCAFGPNERKAAIYVLTTGDVLTARNKLLEELNLHAERLLTATLLRRALILLGWMPSNAREKAICSIVDHKYLSWEDQGDYDLGPPVRLFVTKKPEVLSVANMITGNNKNLFTLVGERTGADILLTVFFDSTTTNAAYSDGSPLIQDECRIYCYDISDKQLSWGKVTREPDEKIYRPLHAQPSDVRSTPGTDVVICEVSKVLCEGWKVLMFNRWRQGTSSVSKTV